MARWTLNTNQSINHDGQQYHQHKQNEHFNSLNIIKPRHMTFEIFGWNPIIWFNPAAFYLPGPS
jgi:hypothetical protein